MIKLLKVGGTGYVFDDDGCYHEYICDAEADIAKLPTGINMTVSMQKPRPGSTAVVANNAAVYMLSNQRVWNVLIPGEL